MFISLIFSYTLLIKQDLCYHCSSSFRVFVFSFLKSYEMFLIRSVYFLYVLTFLKQFYLNNKLVIKILLVLLFICNAKYLKRKSYKSLCSIQFTFHTFLIITSTLNLIKYSINCKSKLEMFFTLLFNSL